MFEKFRNRWLENYGLCPSNHFIATVLSRDAIFSMTKVELDLISDVDMNMFFEKGMTGSVSYIFKRCSKANNKCLISYNPKKPTKYVKYLGENNLYGYTMSKSLPTVRFKSLGPKKFNLDK